ncbi:MAG TPA: translocation/assembly module TamB domain-containing protein [Bryobacteraceae bacterium]|nr:translocation/assembly module TamB domain-containing protein [Bryobacteraceae bacterium]
MNKPLRILRNVAIGLAAFVVVVGLAAVVIVQTDWFRNFVREKIVTATEAGVGGKVELGSFSFSPRRLEAVVSNFVIHGKEPAGSAPFVRVGRVQANLRLFTSFGRILDVSYLGIERPEVNVMVFADGTTNIPEPKEKKPESDTTILDTVVDLAVDYFHLSNGQLAFNSQKQVIDVKGSNLRAQLWYNLVTQNYTGKVSLQPLYVVSGRNTPVVFTVTLPVLLDRNRVGFENAKITTAASDITINGSLEDLKNPKTKARINGHIALSDLQNLANVPLDLKGRNIPSVINIDGNAAVAENRITVDGLRVGLGSSNIEASGTLKDPQGKGALEFKTTLALNELGRLAKVSARPDGVIVANGTAKLDSANNYQVTGNVEGKNLSFSQGSQRIRNVNLYTAINLDPKRIDLKGLRLSALGGQFTGNASLEEFSRYALDGQLRNLNLQTVSEALGEKPLPYDGIVSGPIQAQGDLKTPGAKSLTANAKLSIAPGRRGIPVSGRINAQYNGATGNINVANSYIALPNTRLNLSGSVNNRLTFELDSKNLNDLLAAASPANAGAIKLEGGQARFTGAVTGGMNAPQIEGHLVIDRFSMQGRRFDSLTADLAAAKNKASVTNGLLQRGPMQAQFSASAGLQNWSPKPAQPVAATVSVRNGDLADVMVLAGQPPAGYSGALSLDASVGGTIGNPSGGATLEVAKGTVRDEPFDNIQARINLSDQLVTLTPARIRAGEAQLTMTAEFRHPRESFTTGQLHAHVQSNQVNLAQVRTLQKQRPNTAGLLNLNVDVNGTLTQTKVEGKETTEFQLASVNGDVAARELRFEGQNYGSVNAKAWTAGQTVNYDITSDFAGSDFKVTGATQLTRGYPTTADAKIQNLPVERILVLAKRNDIPARGILSGSAHVSGTMEKPEGSIDLDLSKAVLYDEPLDLVRAKASYLAQRIEMPMLEIVSGPSRIELTARYDHPAGNLKTGDLQFRVNSNRIDLARIRNVQRARPGIAGGLQLAASGAATVQAGNPQVLLKDLNADIGATELTAQGKTFGDLTLKAATTAGRVNFALDSNLVEASIHGKGSAQLAGDYPLDAELTFDKVLWSRVQSFLGKTNGQPTVYDVATEGKVTVNGPVMKTEQMRGSLQLARLQLYTTPRPGANEKPITIRNEGPIAATLDRGVVKVDSAHMVGPETDANVTGSVSLIGDRKMDLNLSAKTDIGLLQNFSQDIYSSGNIVLGATVRGTLAKPLVTGNLELKNASINHVNLPNGISNANGLIVFNGNTATIRTLTAQSGGGKVGMTGFVAMGDQLRLGLRATANSVRVRMQQGVSVVVSAFVNVTGTTLASLASGTININRITYAPQSDMGSILTRAAPPVQSPEAPDPLLDNMRLDVRVRTSSATAVQASLAQNIQLDADLRIRGTASRPGVLGRVLITEGDLVFFGSEYRVSSGTISFYNPVRIEPILNVTLETQAKGVHVVLTVSGPIDNMKLSYTSDPPLQFQEIVGLLASGKTPTSDPTILANQPSQPQQSFQQMGETAIVSKAIADPVASRLQRVFGVSQLKIDPTFTSGSDLPQARVTLEQQVAPNLTFTYVTALEDPNTQIVRIEWSLSRQWSAMANRDENGIFSIDFLYKKQFR